MSRLGTPLPLNENRKQEKEMEKKLYLKPEAEVLDVHIENDLLAGTYQGGEDEIIIPKPEDPGDKPIIF